MVNMNTMSHNKELVTNWRLSLDIRLVKHVLLVPKDKHFHLTIVKW